MLKNMILILIIVSAGLLIAKESFYNNLEPADFDYLLEDIEENEITLIDIRTPQEFDAGHISGAEMIDFYAKDFIEKIAELPRENHYLIYCRTGRRTGIALQYMKQLGFQRVDDLKGGIVSWVNEGYKLVKE